MIPEKGLPQNVSDVLVSSQRYFGGNLYIVIVSSPNEAALLGISTKKVKISRQNVFIDILF